VPRSGQTPPFPASDPSIVDLLLDVISLEYHETIMAPAGAAAEKSRTDAMAKYAGKYLTVVEGAIPTAANGAYCCVNGRTALSIAQEVFAKTAGIVTVGTCAAFGGLPAAAPNPTGAKGVTAAFPSYASKTLNLPGSPMNVVNFVATLVYYISYGKFPSLDSNRRPVFAYGSTVHSRCSRNMAYGHGPWGSKWGDSGCKSSGCLVKLGCRGTQTYSNCSTVKWNGGTCWPVDSGHGCLGCTSPNFWDVNFPYYGRALPAPSCGSCHEVEGD
jgi:hydrogenase small subunit